VNNLKNNLERTLRKPALQKPARGCEPSSLKMSSQLFPLFPIYLDKVLSVTDGDTTRTFTYHADGQLASASCDGIGRAGAHASSDIASQCSLRSGDMRTPQTETFLWDGLALIQRGDEQFINEPHVGGGNPVASSKGTSYFNDALGTTVGAKKDGKYSAAALTAFGEDLTVHSPTPTQNSNFFTGKPFVEGLGHAFLMRNYRAGLAKWQTADPMGYPDGWNQFMYCRNIVSSHIDMYGCVDYDLFDDGFQSDNDDKLREGARNYNPKDRITVAGHGDSSGSGIVASDGSEYSVEDIASMVRGNKRFKESNGTLPVEILACYCGLRDWAQWLADELGVEVTAYTGIVRFRTDGKVFAATGKVKVFKPKKVEE
jgi:RHS repeat-associated protein